MYKISLVSIIEKIIKVEIYIIWNIEVMLKNLMNRVNIIVLDC